MRGLRLEPDEKFRKFFSIVQDVAAKEGSIFFVLSGEGNDAETEDMYMENLSGWLIPKEEADEFEKIWKVNRSSPEIVRWKDYFALERWRKENGKLTVAIEKIKVYI